jgi:hypothetical protein
VAVLLGCGGGRRPDSGSALVGCLRYSGAEYTSETSDFVAAEAPFHGTIAWAEWYYPRVPDLVLAAWPPVADAKEAAERYRALLPATVLGLERRRNLTLNWWGKEPTRKQVHAIVACLQQDN